MESSVPGASRRGGNSMDDEAPLFDSYNNRGYIETYSGFNSTNYLGAVVPGHASNYSDSSVVDNSRRNSYFEDNLMNVAPRQPHSLIDRGHFSTALPPLTREVTSNTPLLPSDSVHPDSHFLQSSTQIKSRSRTSLEADEPWGDESHPSTHLTSAAREQFLPVNLYGSDSSAPGGTRQRRESMKVILRPERNRSSRTSKHVTRSKSTLQRIRSIKLSDIRSSFVPSPREERYSSLYELDERLESDAITVDLSFLEGPGTVPDSRLDEESADQASRSESVPGPKHGKLKVGGGVMVGAEVVVKSPAKGYMKTVGQELTAITVRNYGQGLANDRNVIVAVKEEAPAVDLSVLEGSDSVHAGNLTQRSKTSFLDDSRQQQSFYYPPDPDKPNWKPLPMRTMYIVFLIFVSLLLAGVQEYLFQQSQTLKARGSGLIHFNKVDDIPTVEFFCWKYLPTLVMVTFGVLWQLTEYQVKRLEPYYQLSKPNGNTAAQSINLDYVSLWAYFVPFRALRYRHWTVAMVSIISILATTAAPSLQTPSITPAQNPQCTTNAPCPGGVRYLVQVNMIWSRFLTAILALIALLGVALLFQLRGRKSGLLSDPKGIAGVASMATRSHILTDFQGMDEASLDELHERLRHRHYVLYKSSIWQGEYITMDKRDEFATHKVKNPHPIILRRAPIFLFITYLIVCLVLIPIVTHTPANIVPVTVPWLPTLMAVVIKQLWTTLEFAVKMLEPFYVLSEGNARPDVSLTLDYQGSPYGVLAIEALYHGHYLVGLVGIGTLLADVLTVTASSLSLTEDTIKSFLASSIICITITFFLVVLVILVWIRRRHAFLPRQPSTLASILAFIHQSHMLDNFVNTERYSNKQMETMLLAKGQRYGLGWFRGRDKKPHCGVDEEPMLSKYVHGVSYVKAQAPWEGLS